MDLTLLTAGIDATPAARGADQFNSALDRMVDKTDEGVAKIRLSLSRLTHEFLSLGSVVAGLSFVGAVKSVIEASIQFQRINNVLIATSKNSVQAAARYEGLRQISYKLGLDLSSVAQQYALLTAASKGTTLQGEKTDRIFRAISTASVALSLDSSRVERIMYAVNHMMSKGVVSAQDLRRQLGNNLPGAYNMAAHAMGMTTVAFTAQLKAGNILAKDLLPALADALIERYGKAAEKASNMTQALLNKMKTAIFELKVWVANNGLGEAFDNSIKKITELLRSDELKSAAVSLSKVLGEGVLFAGKAFIFLAQHARAVMDILLVMAASKAFMFFASLAVSINEAKTALLGFSVVQRSLSALNSGTNLNDKKIRGWVSGIVGNIGNSSAAQAWKNHGVVNTFESGHGALPEALMYAVKKTGDRTKLSGAALLASAGKAGIDAAKMKVDMEALNFVLSKNGVILGETAMKAKVAGAGYAALSAETKAVVSEIASGAGMTAGVIQVSKLASGFSAAKAVAASFASTIAGTVVSAFAALRAIVISTWLVMAANPITLTLAAIALGIAAVTAALVLMRNVNVTIGGNTARVGSYVGVVWDKVADTIKDNWSHLKEFFKGITDTIAGYWTELSNNPVWKKAEDLLGKMDFMRKWASAAQSREKYNDMKDKTSGEFAGSYVDNFQNGVAPGSHGQLNPFAAANSHGRATLGGTATGASILNAMGDGSSLGALVRHGSPQALFLQRQMDQPKNKFGLLPPVEDGITDDGEVMQKFKADPLKKYLADQLIEIEHWKAILALENSSKKNLAEINAAKTVQTELESLRASGHPISDQSNAAKQMYNNQILVDSLKMMAEAKTKFDELKDKTVTDNGMLDKEIAYFKQLTSGSRDYKGGLEQLQAQMEAYNATADLQGKVDDKSLAAGRELIAQGYLKKKNIEEQTSAMTAYYTNIREAKQAISDDRDDVAAILSTSGSGKRNYSAFDMNSSELAAQAAQQTDRKIGKDRKNLSAADYTDERNQMINRFKEDAFVTYIKDLKDFAEQAKESIGSIDRLVAEKGKLDDAFSKGMVNDSQLKLITKDMQDSYDAMIDHQLIKTDTWSSGVLVALRQMQRIGDDTAQHISQAFTEAFTGIQDSLIHMLDTGKFSMKGYLDTVRHSLDTILVQKTTTGLLDHVLGGAGNGFGIEKQAGAKDQTWLGKFLDFGKSSSTASIRKPTGSAQDPLYVALTTGVQADVSGLPKILGGNAAASASGAASSPVSQSAALLNSIPLGSTMNKLAAGVKQYGYTGLASNGGATGNNGWMNVVTGFIKGFLGTPGLFAGGGGATAPSLTDMYGQDTASPMPSPAIPFPQFANGGIMTSRGRLSLRKYSTGGIASTPQLAMFGEGKRPEAYVPLPDGKSIPVSMKGGGPGNVNIQHETRIYDQTGRGAAVQSTGHMDGQKYVQEIFIQDLMTEGPIAQGIRSYTGAR